MARRGRRVQRWIIGVGALALFVAAGFAVVQLIADGSDIADTLSGTSQGRKAAERVRSVLASDDLAPPPGATRTLTLQCVPGADSPGEPAVGITYSNVDPAEVQAQLADRGWEDREMPFGDLYIKRFDDFLAQVGFSNPNRPHLTVGGDTLGADCLAFRDGLGGVVTASG
jgi:hypothetical protein